MIGHMHGLAFSLRTLRRTCALAACLALCACADTGGARDVRPASGAASATAPPPRVLVFTRTAGYRHDSIPAAVAAIRALASEAKLQTEHGEDASAFTPANLARYRVVVFANTTGDVLDQAQQRALEDFVAAGGGFVGIHAAADTEYDWPWYGTLVGAWFHSHPQGVQTARVAFADEGIVARGRTWRATDEFYNYRSAPRARIVATLAESDYAGGTMGDPHPIAWCRAQGAGRAWYTGLGHRAALYGDATYLRHLARGLRYAARLSDGC